jgi:cation:H+ antiporter
MFVHLGFIALALILLFLGAEILVKGSSSLALRAGLSRLMVGLTIVAFGTSSPELFVSVKAALAGQGDIAVGNVIGSNSFNIGVILGITALLCPIPVHRQIIRIDAPIALGVACALLWLLQDHRLTRPEGLLLLAGIVGYNAMNLALARKEAATASTLAADADANTDADADASGPSTTRHWTVDVALILGGLAVLVLGSNLLVDNSVALARAFSVSEAVIGLTIVAAGTSMPELATSMVAAIRKQPDIAIGNVVGSNVFNLLGILGVGSVVTPLHAPGISALDGLAMIVFSALLIPLLYTGRLLHRLEGALLLGLYSLYLAMLWPK